MTLEAGYPIEKLKPGEVRAARPKISENLRGTIPRGWGYCSTAIPGIFYCSTVGVPQEGGCVKKEHYDCLIEGSPRTHSGLWVQFPGSAKRLWPPCIGMPHYSDRLVGGPPTTAVYVIFYRSGLTTSAVGSTNLGSMLICASCVLRRSPVFQ